jgi:hypothetical protein
VTQAGDVNRAIYLDELRDRVLSALGSGVPTATWTVKRDAFLDGLGEVLGSLEGPTIVPAEMLKAAEERYQAAMTEISIKNKAIEALNNQIHDLEKCKDAEQVKALDRKYSSSQEQFDNLVDAAKTALSKISGVTTSAIFCELRGESCQWSDSLNWGQVHDAKQNQEIDADQNFCTPRKQHIRVGRAQIALSELSRFLENDSNCEFVAKLEKENDLPITLKNREFWQRFLNLYP